MHGVTQQLSSSAYVHDVLLPEGQLTVNEAPTVQKFAQYACTLSYISLLDPQTLPLRA